MSVNSSHNHMLLLLISLGSLKAIEEQNDCIMLGSLERAHFFKDGDILIGGAFSLRSQISSTTSSFTDVPEPLRCTRIDAREFRFAHTMIFAIEEINSSGVLLPNISIGYKVLDSCDSPQRAVMALLNGQELHMGGICSGLSAVQAIIGASESSSTIVMLQMAGIFKIPVISHFATCACLSNRKQYPTFFRTIPSDFYQSRALAKLIKHFGWTWVGAVRSDNDYGNNGMATFITAAAQEGVCVEYSEAISRTDPIGNIASVVKMIHQGTANVLVAFLAQVEMLLLLEEAQKQNMRRVQWVGSESWITAGYLASPRYAAILTGSLGFTLPRSSIPGLEEFLLQVNPMKDPQNSLLREFWEETFGCSFGGSKQADICTGSEQLKDVASPFTDVSELRISHNVYKAVYAVAHAFHSQFKCTDRGCILGNSTDTNRVVERLQQVKFTTETGETVHFDENGDPSATYELVNWQYSEQGGIAFVAVGSYDAFPPDGNQFEMNGKAIMWADNSNERPQSVCSHNCPSGFRQAQIKGKPPCCFSCVRCAAGEITHLNNSDCMSCPLEFWSNINHSECVPKVIEFLSYTESMGAVLAALSLFGAALTLMVICVFFRFRHTPLVKASNSELSFLLLFSLMLCFLCSLTFIGRPSEWSCMLRHTAFGITFALCMSCILAKTFAVVFAFKWKRPVSSGPVQCSIPIQRTSVFICTLIQVVVCVLWLSLAPPLPHKNVAYANNKIILECQLGSAIGFWAVLSYIGVLAIMCFILAFLARKLPDNFNEAKFITFSMLIFCAVWITFIPAYVSSPGKFTVAVEIFAILASSLGLLFCIFFPKCYVLLLKPGRNTKKHMMGRIS